MTPFNGRSRKPLTGHVACAITRYVLMVTSESAVTAWIQTGHAEEKIIKMPDQLSRGSGHPRVRIMRRQLVQIVSKASRGCAGSTRLKLHAVAESAASVAVGHFHCGGTGCPARQAGLSNQKFQQAYDTAMWRLFPHLEYSVFIADVSDD